MILSDRDIKHHVVHGKIGISPFDYQRVQPASYDVALGTKFRVFDKSRNVFIDPTRRQEGLTEMVEIIDRAFVLHPSEFVLATTEEFIKLGPDIAARLEGKSSLGRVGLIIHSTAGWIDPGFEGTITLELGNAANLPILLWPGMLIGQIAFMQMASAAERPYGSDGLNSKYQGQVEPTASRMWTQGQDPATLLASARSAHDEREEIRP